MYIRLLNCFWDLHSEISGRTRAIKWRLTRDTFQRENKIAKENTTMKVGKKVATSGESRRDSTKYHVKSIISPGIKRGLSSIFNFFFRRSSLLSFKCLRFLILSASARYRSAFVWHL